MAAPRADEHPLLAGTNLQLKYIGQHLQPQRILNKNHHLPGCVSKALFADDPTYEPKVEYDSFHGGPDKMLAAMPDSDTVKRTAEPLIPPGNSSPPNK